VAWAVPGDTWLMSVAVAGLVAAVIIGDDVQRRRAPVDPGDAADADG